MGIGLHQCMVVPAKDRGRRGHVHGPLGTGRCQGSAWGLWAGRTSEAELEENGIFQGCWHQIQVGRS